MGNYDDNQADNLELMSFDLGEVGGGKQMIFASKPINDREYYVLTLGEAPRSENEKQTAADNANPATKTTAGKQLLSSIRQRIPGLNKNNANQIAAVEEEQNLKLRCFKLSRLADGKKYAVEEYVTPKGVSDVARFMGAGKHEHETDM